MYFGIDWEVFAVNVGIICRKFAGIVVFFYSRGSVYLLWCNFAADEPEDDEENHVKKDELLLPPPVPPKLKKFKEMKIKLLFLHR